MKVIGTFDNRSDWLQARRKGLGASDIAGIVGVSPWSTPWQVYVDKVGAAPLDDEGTEQMRWGQLLEQLVLDEWERESGLHAYYRGALVQHDIHDWALASLDALAFEATIEPDGPTKHAIAVVEAKTTSDYAWAEIPLHYQAQAQWQMAVTGLDSVIFTVLHGGRALRVYELKADYDDQRALLEAAEKFWTDHVLAEVPPTVEASDNALLATVYPLHDEAEQEVDGDLVDRLARVRANESQIKRQRDELEARIKETLGPAAVATVEGQPAATWRTQTSRRLDTKRLRAEQPAIADQYTTETESRVFRFTWKGDN